MTRDCRCCGGPLVHDVGPVDEPDRDRNVVIEEVWACPVCTASRAVQHEPITREWVRRRRALVGGAR